MVVVNQDRRLWQLKRWIGVSQREEDRVEEEAGHYRKRSWESLGRRIRNFTTWESACSRHLVGVVELFGRHAFWVEGGRKERIGDRFDHAVVRQHRSIFLNLF